MLERLHVGLGDRSYPVLIGEGILPQLGSALRQVAFPSQVAVVTNPTVEALYAGEVLRSLRASRFDASLIVVPDGEEFKNLQTLQTVFDALIEGGFDRYSGLIALGGGVIGDLTGFAAATFLRGIPFAQVPTTLLSQVDSSVGGKTGINHPLGKNLIGAFHQPRHVHIDTTTLRTLPAREFNAGMAEVIKYGIIRDARFFRWLQQEQESLRRLDGPALAAAISKSCQIKADIVEHDETERSLRAILNYGHTFGHAVETLAGYGVIRHGEAVAIGMAVIAGISLHLDLCSAADLRDIRELIVAYDLPVDPPPFALDRYLGAMERDKKMKEGVLRLILNRGIGDCVIQEVVHPEKLFSAVVRTDPLKQVHE
jgi:3-dehydroquinate synthase